MARPLRLGFVALAALVSVKLLSDLSGVDTLSEMLNAGRATAAVTEGEAALPPETSAEASSGTTGSCPADSNPALLALPEMLAAIAVERDTLRARTADLDAREAEIALARATVLKQNQELTKLREDVAALLEQAKATEEADIARLVRIYEAMKPAVAATILQDADLELSVLVLAAMAERNAGPIMAEMTPDRANAVARILLERSRLPGDQVPVVVELN